MITQASKFRVGVFVLVGLALLLGTLFWLGTSAYLKGYKVYVTYFKETVQGLDKGASVKYLGVKVGEVASIDLAPDGKLVEVIMHLDPARQIEPDMRCQLELTGITGTKFIQLIRLTSTMTDASPKLAFKPRYPYIPSAPSLVENVITAVKDIIRRMGKLNIEAMVDGANKTMKAVFDIVRDPRWKKIAPRLDAIMASLQRTAQKIEAAFDQREMARLRTDLLATLGNLRRVTANLDRQLITLQLGSKGRKVLDGVSKLVADLRREVGLIRYSLRETGRNLDRASAELRSLIETVKRQPSQLIWGDPPRDRFPGAK